MGDNKNININEVIEKGLKLMYQHLLEKAIRNDKDLVTRDEQGKIIRIKASLLKARLK